MTRQPEVGEAAVKVTGNARRAAVPGRSGTEVPLGEGDGGETGFAGVAGRPQTDLLIRVTDSAGKQIFAPSTAVHLVPETVVIFTALA
jgi:hypothetical protein